MRRTLRLPAGLFRLRWVVLVTRAPLRLARGRGLRIHELWALSTAMDLGARTHTGSVLSSSMGQASAERPLQ